MNSIELQLSDAYSCRSLLDYLRQTISDVNFRFTKDTITICESNASNTILHEVTIKACDIKYTKNSDADVFCVGVYLPEICRMLKSVHRKDQITLLVEEDSTQVACIVSSTVQNVSFINIKNDIPINEFDKPPIPSTFITVSPPDFSKMMVGLCQTKPVSVEISCSPNGVSLHALGGQDNILKEYVIGSIEDEDCIVSHCIHTATAKSLSRVNTMCSHGTMISIHYDVDMPIQIKFRVGVYAEYSMLLRCEM
jgi:hypothetical protein